MPRKECCLSKSDLLLTTDLSVLAIINSGMFIVIIVTLLQILCYSPCLQNKYVSAFSL